MTPLQMWAGAECTVNRVGDGFHDQMEASGFAQRLDDLDRLADLGVACIRLPLLWERCAPEGPGLWQWTWSDARVQRLRDLGVAPIAGLLHHGSGPRWTNLLDPAFPHQLAAYACAVAQRYPHINAYTPVNEPLTTARFSGLYGLWYPHRRDDAAFVRALLHQVQGTVLAMREIRAVNPQAQLVQTEDLGFASSTPALAYQARFENERRWLSLDLLAGRVRPGHPLWQYLRSHGAGEAELQALHDCPCTPDVVGINSYVTSERFLDERVHRYAPRYAGGNGRDRYADVETVRASATPLGGMQARLREAAVRYGLPVAATEVHLGCTREEQMRWLHAAWRGAMAVRAEGHDVRAVTAWAAFGCHDWDSLATRTDGHYEPGLWDARSDPPRITALAVMTQQLATQGTATHPVLQSPGWWERPDRLHSGGPCQTAPAGTGRTILVTGAGGTLARAFARLCAQRGLVCKLADRYELDIANAAAVDAALVRWQPWAVVNAAGFVRVDAAEYDMRQWRENAAGPGCLARACARHGVRFVNFSTDLVFDGGSDTPYLEGDTPHPLSQYGRAKHVAESRVLHSLPNALVVRSAAFFGPWDGHNFVTRGLQALRRGETWAAVQDQCVSPTYVPDLVHATLDLLIDGEHGIWHLANRGAVSWVALAHMAAEAAGLDVRGVCGVPGTALRQVAKRPCYSALASRRGQLMPRLEDGLARYVKECTAAW